jgi:peptidyl-dipeptidase A
MKMGEKEISKFVQEHTSKIKPLYKKLNLAYWDAAITGKKEFYDKYEQAQVKIERLYNNKEEFEIVKSYKDCQIKDPLLRRQIDILYNSYLGSQGDIELIKKQVALSTQIEGKFNVYRAKVNGKEMSDNEIKDILKKSKNSQELKEAWEANKKQGEFVASEVLELVKLRNQLAKSRGFDNYYVMSMNLSEQDPKEIEKIFKELEKLTDKPFKEVKNEMDKYLKKRYNVKKLEPWHYQDLFFQEGPEIYPIELDKYYDQDILQVARKFYSSIGLPVESILEKSDLYEKPGKYQHACCMDLDREGDVRIIENIKNNESWMETTLHELGHGVYSMNIDRKLPFLLRDNAHIFTTEAIAMLFGRQPKNPEFIGEYCKISDKELKELEGHVKKSLRMRQLVFSRWVQVMMNFERELYKNPEQNLNLLWWRLVARYQLIEFSRDKPDWASKIHLVSAPVYYHNYMLGEMLASQISAYAKKNILKSEEIDFSGKREFGKYLTEKIFAPGKRYEWNEMIKKATGEYLDAKYFVGEFCS